MDSGKIIWYTKYKITYNIIWVRETVFKIPIYGNCFQNSYQNIFDSSYNWVIGVDNYI